VGAVRVAGRWVAVPVLLLGSGCGGGSAPARLADPLGSGAPVVAVTALSPSLVGSWVVLRGRLVVDEVCPPPLPGRTAPCAYLAYLVDPDVDPSRAIGPGGGGITRVQLVVRGGPPACDARSCEGRAALEVHDLLGLLMQNRAGAWQLDLQVDGATASS
jgi:hypothetical protein